jgi:hypothetical protein
MVRFKLVVLKATGFRQQASGFRLQATGFRLQASGFGLQVISDKLKQQF